MTTIAADIPDGPWRVAARFRVAVVGSVAEAKCAETVETNLRAGGLPVDAAVAVRPDALSAILAEAAASGSDLLVLDARASVTPAAVAELRRVADGDPMIAAVEPRFSTESDRGFDSVPPPVSYGLVPDARCLYVKISPLVAFGDARMAASPSLAALLLGLNRFGFRVVVAGTAMALHPDGPRAAAPDAVPAEWRPAFDRDRSSAPRLAEALMQGLRPRADGRRVVAFDLSHAGPNHSGTTWLARALVRRAAWQWDDLALQVVATPETFAFHFGDLNHRVARTDPADPRIVAALIRFGQPFLWKEVDAALRRAPVLVLFMLDTIGLDCQHHAPDELDALWRFCLAESDGLLFNSAFTARQFARRFALPAGRPALPSLHSLDLGDYRLADADDTPAAGGVLMIGNAMPHKHLAETARLLASAGLSSTLTVLGLAPDTVPGVTSVLSGTLSPERLAALYAAANVVVYPSVYEGFGFPILDALAHRRPILVRPLPPYAEIAAGLPEAANIHTFSSDADLLRLLRDPPAWTEARREMRVRTWDDAVADLRAVLDAAIAGADHARVVRRIDALRGRMSFMRSLALGRGTDDELDRLASLAGRLARNGVLWIGQRVPGSRRFLGAVGRRLRGGGLRFPA